MDKSVITHSYRSATSTSELRRRGSRRFDPLAYAVEPPD